MLDKNKKRKSDRRKALEEALRAFWQDYSRASTIQGAHTEFFIEPRIVIAEKINPEVARKLVAVYLSQVTPEQILNEDVFVTPNQIVIRDEKGQTILEINDPALIDEVTNEVTAFVGTELSQREKTDGEPYVEKSRRETYSFGEIKEALVDFLLDQAKQDSKNLLKDATLLLLDESGSSELVRPKF